MTACRSKCWERTRRAVLVPRAASLLLLLCAVLLCTVLVEEVLLLADRCKKKTLVQMWKKSLAAHLALPQLAVAMMGLGLGLALRLATRRRKG